MEGQTCTPRSGATRPVAFVELRIAENKINRDFDPTLGHT